MPNYGDIISGVKEIWVATLENDNTGAYGVPAYIEYPQSGGYEPTHDNDAIKAGGAEVEALSVQINSMITLNEASMRDDAVTIITGENATESGTSGNRRKRRIHRGGGAGLPYFGMVQVFNGTNGSFYVAGFAKCMAETKPTFKAEQNKFRVGEMKIKALAIAESENFIAVLDKYENEADIPDFSDATEFEDFMSVAWS